MYYSHFGLTQPPFRITPDTEFFFGGANRGPILEALIYAIRQGEGVIKVTGEVGSGKTMLCNMLQTRLPAHVETVYLANPSVSPDEILCAIALELQLELPPESSRLETMQLLHDHLLERHAQGKQVVVFVEESQSMPIATLEEIRLLTNLETAHSKLLQIVLFGQPEFDANLRQPQIRQLRDRVTQSFRLAPLRAEEVGEYLAFRLRAGGYHGPDLFSPRVVKAIAGASGGLTRRINVIADKALLAAFAENTHTVKPQHVRAAVRDSEFDEATPYRPRLRVASAVSLLAIGAGMGIAIYAAVQAYQDRLGAPAVADGAAGKALRAEAGNGSPAGSTSRMPADQPAEGASARSAPTPSAPEAVEIRPEAQPVQGVASQAPAAVPAVKGPAAPAAVTPPAAPADLTPVAAVVPTPAPAGAVTPAATRAEQTLSPDTTEPLANPRASANSRSGTKAGDILEIRLSATASWLQEANKSTYSIQLLGTDNERQLKQHLNVISKSLEINDIFVYRTTARQKPSLTVLYGSFPDRRTALESMARLPASLRAYRPYLRTVQGIRAEIAQRNS
jgi:MSHA biogenesis protein MshM